MVIKFNSTYSYILLILIVSLFSSNKILSKTPSDISFSLFGKANIPDRNYALKSPSGLALRPDDPKLYYSFGFTVAQTKAFYGVKFDYGSFLEGSRATLAVQFMHRSVISPYLGISYISNVDRIVTLKRKNYIIQGYDGIFGVSVSLLNIFKLNAEYTINTSIWFMGGSIHIPLKYNTDTRKKTITFDLGE